MSKNHKQSIEEKITNALQQEVTRTSTTPSKQLLQAVRQQQQSFLQGLVQYQMPLWQVAATVLLCMLGGHYIFPKVITLEKSIVQTEIQPTFICQTDTLVQIQAIEKIVHIPVPTAPKFVAQPTPENKINPLIDAIDNTALMLNPSSLVATKTSTTINNHSNSKPSNSLGRSIQEDADLMEFTIESEQFSTMPVQLKNE